jgi:hypothetical protein
MGTTTPFHCGYQALYSLSQLNYGGQVALLPGIHHAFDSVEHPHLQNPDIVRVLKSMLIDTQHIQYYQPTSMSMPRSIEQSELVNMLATDYHAHDADASPPDYDWQSKDYPTFSHSSHEMESAVGSPAVYNTLVPHAPTALRFVDACANISVKANRTAFHT